MKQTILAVTAPILVSMFCGAFYFGGTIASLDGKIQVLDVKMVNLMSQFKDLKKNLK